MLEELIGKLKSEVGGQLSQAQLPAGSMESIFSVIGDAVKKEASGQIIGGNLSHLMNLFSDKPNTESANQIQSDMHSGVVSELTSKLGISPEQSKGIAEVALPALINMITKKNNTTPDDDPSPLHELFGESGGGGLGEAAKNLLGKFLK
jgi:hypothetical protein